jgi:alpha-1,2-mannosyltransferase
MVAALAGLLLVGTYLAIWGQHYGLDLSVYRDASLSWRHGANPYLSTFSEHGLNFTYPPFALVFLVPSTLASFHVAQLALWILSIGLTTCAVAFVLRDGGIELTKRTWNIALVWTCVSLLVLEPVRSGLDYGQIEFVLMFLVVGDLLVVPRRFKGVALGVASAVKLTPLFFILVLVACRDFKAAARALVTFAGLTALSWLFWPGLSATYWRTDVANAGRVGQVAYLGNQSFLGVFHRAPFVGSPTEALWLGMSLVAIAASVFVAWRSAAVGLRALAMIAVALGGLLVSPISWSHHWVWVMLIPPALFMTRNKGVPRTVRVLLWGIVAIAALGPYWWFSGGWQSDAFGALLPTWTMALLISWAAIEIRRPPSAADDSLRRRREERSGEEAPLR